MSQHYNRRKYVPYATQRQREEQEERERKLAQEESEKKQLENTEENFPTLMGGVAPPPKILPKSFANLASEWKDHEEDKKVYDAMEPKYPVLNLPKFHTIHRFVEEEEQEEQVEEAPKSKPVEEEWTVVKSKYKPRRAKTLIEKYGDPDAPEEEVHEEEETVWRESHQTCWDEKTT